MDFMLSKLVLIKPFCFWQNDDYCTHSSNRDLRLKPRKNQRQQAKASGRNNRLVYTANEHPLFAFELELIPALTDNK